MNSLVSKEKSHIPVEKNLVSSVVSDHVSSIIIGSLAQDTIATIGKDLKMKDSNLGLIKSSIGGVGYNIALACHYGSKSPSCDNGSSRLVSIIGNDFAGNSILKHLETVDFDTSGIHVSNSSSGTAQYISQHSHDGELLVACADMSIVEEDFSGHILQQLERAKPTNIILDCNVSASVMDKILDYKHRCGGDINIIVEPTSFPKSKRLAQAHHLTFPNNAIKLITPTQAELESIHSEFSEKGYFEDYDNWFPMLDSLGINTEFRNRCEVLGRKTDYAILGKMFQNGTIQQSLQLLPYFQTILVKLGELGVVLVSISTSVEDHKSIPTTSQYKPRFTVTSTGTKINNNHMGVVIQYYPIPQENVDIDIKNVTGAGDSFLGYLVARLLSEHPLWLEPEISTVEQEWNKWESIYKAQLASGLSLMSDASISPQLLQIK